MLPRTDEVNLRIVPSHWLPWFVLLCVGFTFACTKESNLERVDEVEGTERRIGTLKEGKKHGQWITYDDGALYEIKEWRDGVLHGPFRSFYDDRRPWSDGTFRNGQLHGRYRVYFDNGQIAQLSWFDLGHRDLTWCEWHPNGALQRLVIYQFDQIMREEFDPPGTCPLLQGDGVRHLDPKDTDYR